MRCSEKLRRPVDASPDDGELPVITAENWITLRNLPPRLLILSGSYIALEMAQAYQRLGSEVTVLQKADQLAEREDKDVAGVLQAALEADGCRVRLGVDVQRVEAIGWYVRVHLADGALNGSHSFLATGRQPNTDDLGLATLGVRLDQHGHVEVDDHRKTEGFIKVIVDADTDAILGATALCEQGAEIVQLFVELMNSGATTAVVLGAIHIHPTLAEAAKNAVLVAASAHRREA